MATDYSTWEASDLLEALELSGRIPNSELIQACLNRSHEMIPGLLDMLSSGTRAYWSTDDPRWYRDAHAGVLLVAAHEEEALPIFDQVLRDPNRQEVVEEWFLEWLPQYGQAIVPQLLTLVQDEQAWLGGRTSGLQLLGIIGEMHPEETARIVPVLTSLLPRLLQNGTLDLTTDPENVAPEKVDLWTWTVSALTDLRDAETREQVIALYKAGLLDEDQIGDVDDYRIDMEDDIPAIPPEPLDALKFYKTLEAWDLLSDEDLVEALYTSLIEGGIDPDEADELREEMLEMLGMSLDDEEDDIGMEVLESFMQRMRDAGVPEDELEEAVEDLLRNLDDFDDVDFDDVDFEDPEVEENQDDDMSRWVSSSPRLVMRSTALLSEQEDYMSMPSEELLEALERMDIPPDPALIKACLNRGAEITNGLLSLLKKGFSKKEVDVLPDDAPQWFREVHAALLLTELREERALPIFERILKDPFRIPMLEWLDPAMAVFGASAVPLLIRVTKDKTLDVVHRATAVSILAQIATCCPDTRDNIISLIRRQLPSQVQIDRWLDEQDINDYHLKYNTCIAIALTDLRDTVAQSKVETLLANSLVDIRFMGSIDDYRVELASSAPLSRLKNCEFHILDAYDWILEEEDDLFEDVFDEDLLESNLENDADDSETESQIAYGREDSFVRTMPKVGRNDPCPCGSGKKYKKCCLKTNRR